MKTTSEQIVGEHTVGGRRVLVQRFKLDEARARAFLHRALRCYTSSLTNGESDGVSQDENWTLKPGWNTDNIVSDELTTWKT